MFQQRRTVAPDPAARDIGGRNTHPGFTFVSTEKRNNLSGCRIYILLENPVIDLRETLVRLFEMLTGGMGTEPVETAGLRPSATAAHRLAVITLDAEINRTGTSAAAVIQGRLHHRKNGLLYLLSGHNNPDSISTYGRPCLSIQLSSRCSSARSCRQDNR